MAETTRVLRADAERNRRRLLDAALELFSERGLDVGVGEIAARAGVGRGTLFRNFASKEDLIAAIVSERMREATAAGRELLASDDPGEAVFEFLGEIIEGQRTNRALVDAIEDTMLKNEEIACGYEELMGVLAELVARAQEAGEIRADVGALDLMVMTKGICEAASALQHVNPDMAERQLDLVRAALSSDAASKPLRGRAPTVEDMRKAFQKH
ncbi:MAG TPA: helix-turn-helix domain-containing protein [Solirubrobacteraceae bacterium]|nr:helix-turn-helix domain-containing protein [Solirubrobacteraceae bacterium]